ncbi:MAG: NAD(+) synthase [Ruminococcaceae bacterium]|nr:NAD(+) synthase [Oscillospiraceae bacterium]
MFQWIRVGAAAPALALGNPKSNAETICNQIKNTKDAALLVFPQLTLTGNTCGDLLFQSTLQEDTIKAIQTIAKETGDFNGIVVFGAPLMMENRLYNCAVVMAKGTVLGIVPKSYLSHNEVRWFGRADELAIQEILPHELGLCQEEPVPVGGNLMFDAKAFRFGVELGEDALSPLSPGTHLALNGADVIVNPTAIKETVKTKLTAKEQSEKNLCAYVQVSAGEGESTTDYVLSGSVIIAELGKPLAQSENCVLMSDVDIEKIRSERMKNPVFHQAKQDSIPCRVIAVFEGNTSDGSLSSVPKAPFIPENTEDRRNRCLHIFKIQAKGLCRRLQVTGGNMVIGVSGGLDSTLALLVCAYAARKLQNSSESVCGITMPCFGTTDRTYQNSLTLMKALGVTALEIPIADSVTQHFKDIGHNSTVKDTTYENSQARERTQVLMDVSNRRNAIVVGTGDMSELALGWCTYNGDHMSMYGVNADIPKTMIYWVIESIIAANLFPDANEVLADILDTPISPELLPPNEDGTIAQKTEDLVGPYELHDFYLYYVLRHGFSPKKIYTLACRAFTEYNQETILKWLKTFYRRFFTQQFKRSCMPDGVKIGSVGLSPRGDWQMPSDASFAAWSKELDEL